MPAWRAAGASTFRVFTVDAVATPRASGASTSSGFFMGVDPYLIAPTLILSVAQRLARLTWPASRKLVPMDESIKMQIEEQLKDLPAEFKKDIKIKNEMYETVPSSDCQSGTRGRIAVFEMFKVDK